MNDPGKVLLIAGLLRPGNSGSNTAADHIGAGKLWAGFLIHSKFLPRGNHMRTKEWDNLSIRLDFP